MIQKTLALAVLLLLPGATLFAQSGRQKPEPSPAPTAINPCKVTKDLEAKPLTVQFNVEIWPKDDIDKTDVRIYEDGIPQELTFFNHRQGQLNYGLVVDTTGSLRPDFANVISAAAGMISMNSPEDETFLIRFVSADKIEMVQDWTSDQALLRKGLDGLFIEGGQSAIIDAVYTAAKHLHERLKTANTPRRAGLVLITDGEDRQSYKTEYQLKKLIRDLSIQVFVIAFTHELEQKASLRATKLLQTLAQESGGRVLFVSHEAKAADAVRTIHRELSAQYSVGYTSTNQLRDRSVRNIRVEIADKPGREKRLAFAQPTYVALCQ